ncbi:CYTH domain-containing protein [Devosia yakushimensis]|uniref:CYTH domain-containing protein n=1 Tax=Devosia yakushimensis TaxID=470028 RepID=A0ABQ5UD29_9HYPH|nr:CYTH domain-containing protein [Devosia yakushimensis]GLQ09100.1 CYTH domain-containing protein [Devosia yakushimensis]
MAQEIERKFLVTGEGWKALATSSALLRQGYLSSNSKATVRVRSKDDQKAALTLKGAARGISRAEFEYDIPIEDARELLAMAAPHVLEKRRHIVPFGGLIWEVDIFEGRHLGLMIAEVELEREDQPVALPDWVGAEVSLDERYFNASLARSETVPGVK